jgi:hypothetical protein
MGPVKSVGGTSLSSQKRPFREQTGAEAYSPGLSRNFGQGVFGFHPYSRSEQGRLLNRLPCSGRRANEQEVVVLTTRDEAQAASLSPRGHLSRVTKLFGRPWAEYDAARNRLRATDSSAAVPDWCFAPQTFSVVLAQNILERQNRYIYADRIVDEQDLKDFLAQLQLMTDFHVLASWRAGQGIYHLHPAIVQELWSTPLTGDLPTEIFQALPEWCVYIPLPDLELKGKPKDLQGFFAQLDWSNSSNHLLLSLGDQPQTPSVGMAEDRVVG